MTSSAGAGFSEALPEFSVRVSARAKCVRLSVTAREGLVVVVPRGWRGDAAAIVASKCAWAESTLARVADRRVLHAAGPDALLPDVVELRALGEVWPVEYRHGAGNAVRARREGGVLAVAGAVDDAEACLAALGRWLHTEAREYLPRRLAELASEHGLFYASVRVAAQRSRWGSCSARGTISLNRNAMFLAPEIVDALLLHELAHTVELNHSARFWGVLVSMDPAAHEHRLALRAAGPTVPAWAER